MTLVQGDTMFEQAGLFDTPERSLPSSGKGGTKAGPKAQAETDPLPWTDLEGVDSLAWFMRTWLTVPRGGGAGSPMRLRAWQRDMSATLYDPRTSLAVWVLPRGQGKSGIAAAIALHHVFNPGNMGARVAVVAQDERSARRLLKTAARMVELSPDLSCRAVVYRDRIVVPGTDAEVTALPAEAHRVEGSDLDLAILDEIGFMPADTFEAAVLSVGKVAGGKVLCIGTPSPAKFRDVSPLWGLVVRGRSQVENDGLALVEYGAPPDADILDPRTWARANPAHEINGDDGWLTSQSISAQAPPTTRENEFRRARLGQWVESSTEPAFPPEAWKKCARTGVKIPYGTPVVLALDGSHSSDSTALLLASVSSKPHVQVAGLWEPSKESDDYVVPIAEVEDRCVELAEQYQILEVVADPFRWQRSLQVLEERGLPVTVFPQTAARLTPATNDLRTAVSGGNITHANDERLNRHILRASIQETTRGVKIAKPTGNEKIDLAACLIMAFSRAEWLAGKKRTKKKKRSRNYAR